MLVVTQWSKCYYPRSKNKVYTVKQLAHAIAKKKKIAHNHYIILLLKGKQNSV